MSRSTVFLLLAIAGAVVPYVFFVDFFANGTSGFVAGLFANGAAGGFAADVLISSLVFWIWMIPEARRVGVRHAWLLVVVNLAIGLSCALPLFLWLRERSAAHKAAPHEGLSAA